MNTIHINRVLRTYFSPFRGLGGLLIALLVLASCDSGNIAEKNYTATSNGKTVKLTARVRGLQSLDNSQYCVALSGFDADSKFAVVQRTLSSQTADSSEVTMVLSNISSEISTVELVLSNSLRKRILTIASVDMSKYENNSPTDTIHMDLGDLNLSIFGCIEKGVFSNACIQCHGLPGHAAADMSLTEGNAYANLVNVPSTRITGETRVIAGDAKNSLLRKLLNEGGENLLHYNHTEVLSSQFKTNLSEVKTLLDQWIDDGAKE